MRAFVFLGLLFSACRPAPPATPVSAYLAFLSAVRQGDDATAFQRFSKLTRERLSARVHALSAASGGAVDDDAGAWIFAGPQPSAMPSEVSEVSRTDSEATLAVTADGGTSTVHMVQEAGEWKVDLSSALQ